MPQITAAVEQVIAVARLIARLLLAGIVLAGAAKLLGINVPYLRVTDGNLQAVAAFVAAAAYALR